MKKEDLVAYFTRDIEPIQIGQKVGMEVETQFLRRDKTPITDDQSKEIFSRLYRFEWSRWHAKKKERGGYIVELEDKAGNAVKYDLGWQNIELSTTPMHYEKIVDHAKKLLQEIYSVAEDADAFPLFAPILSSSEDFLIVPDDRDLTWIALDGRDALAPLARIASVQFTVAVESPHKAIEYLNRLGRMIGHFLEKYLQDRIWKEYIWKSRAGYHPLRYGGPLFFQNIGDYCEKLLEHDYVYGSRLIPCAKVESFDIPLFLRSIWWYFRLRRYGNNLCIEVRTFARNGDHKLRQQLAYLDSEIFHF